MDGYVDSTLAKGLLQFLYEEALAANSRQRRRAHFVAASADRHDFHH
jgi:hypothetical protein